MKKNAIIAVCICAAIAVAVVFIALQQIEHQEELEANSKEYLQEHLNDSEPVASIEAEQEALQEREDGVDTYIEKTKELNGLEYQDPAIMLMYFDAIDIGDSYSYTSERLSNISKGIMISETGSEDDPDHSTVYKWEGNNGASITCVFVNDQLESKSQEGLG